MIEERGYVDRIIWEEFHYNSKFILAVIKTYEEALGVYAGDGKYARIQFSSSLNFCWRRFVVLKEMYHCMLDMTDAERVSTPDGLMRLAEQLVAPGLDVEVAGFEAFETESIAEVLALETLFPLELRQYHSKDFEDGNITAYQLALRYRIPELYVEYGMHPHYMQAINEWRGEDNLVL